MTKYIHDDEMTLEELSRLRELEQYDDLQEACRELLIHIADCDCGHTIWADRAR